MLNLMKRFVQEEDGATMVEYGLMLALIAAVCVGVVTLIGTNLNGKFDEINTAIK
jgi:pilus assembly protein Flp/PilA